LKRNVTIRASYMAEENGKLSILAENFSSVNERLGQVLENQGKTTEAITTIKSTLNDHTIKIDKILSVQESQGKVQEQQGTYIENEEKRVKNATERATEKQDNWTNNKNSAFWTAIFTFGLILVIAILNHYLGWHLMS
jgi:hypothetical protein